MVVTKDRMQFFHRELSGICDHYGCRGGTEEYSMLCRASGILGSWDSFKPDTLERFMRNLTQLVKHRLKVKPKMAIHKPATPMKIVDTATNDRTPSRGCEVGPNGIHRQETCEIMVEAIIAQSHESFKVVVEGRPHWIPKSLIDNPEQFSRGTRNAEMTVPMWFAKQERIIE